MSKNKIMHYIEEVSTDCGFESYQLRYLCNGACGSTFSKSTKSIKRVTCKNCLRKLKNIGWDK